MKKAACQNDRRLCKKILIPYRGGVADINDIADVDNISDINDIADLLHVAEGDRPADRLSRIADSNRRADRRAVSDGSRIADSYRRADWCAISDGCGIPNR